MYNNWLFIVIPVGRAQLIVSFAETTNSVSGP